MIRHVSFCDSTTTESMKTNNAPLKSLVKLLLEIHCIKQYYAYVVEFPSILLIQFFKVVIHYLKNKVGVVDFANAQGLVMF